MSDNRMFLIHKPSSLGVLLGKRTGLGWYAATDKDRLNSFFDYLNVSPKGSQDDFILAMEDCNGSDCFDGWKYGDLDKNGFRMFEYT